MNELIDRGSRNMKDDEIKIQRMDPFGHMTLTEAEMLAALLAGEWVQMPVRYMTREELEELYPGVPTSNTGAGIP